MHTLLYYFARININSINHPMIFSWRQMWIALETACKNALTPASLGTELSSALESFPKELLSLVAKSPDQEFTKLLGQERGLCCYLFCQRLGSSCFCEIVRCK